MFMVKRVEQGGPECKMLFQSLIPHNNYSEPEKNKQQKPRNVVLDSEHKIFFDHLFLSIEVKKNFLQKITSLKKHMLKSSCKSCLLGIYALALVSTLCREKDKTKVKQGAGGPLMRSCPLQTMFDKCVQAIGVNDRQ